jgi:hypothetical protein
MDGFRYDVGQDIATGASGHVGYRFWDDSSTPTLETPLGKGYLNIARRVL